MMELEEKMDCGTRQLKKILDNLSSMTVEEFEEWYDRYDIEEDDVVLHIPKKKRRILKGKLLYRCGVTR